MLLPLKRSLAELHFDHSLWLNELLFFKEELKIFGEHLEEVASKNTSNELHVKIEQFQNRFLIQNNEIDILKHDINQNEDQVVLAAKEHEDFAEYEVSDQHLRVRERMVIFRKLYMEMKVEFMRELEKWM